MDQGEHVRLAGREHPLERPPQHRRTLVLRVVRVVREHLEQRAPNELFAAPCGHPQIGVVDGDVRELPIQQHVWIGGKVEEGLEVYWREHARPISLQR
jgi:hypothetical protein